VAALAFPDRSFDLVGSTLSMHHWADPTAGLAEIGRVLRPGALALIWDFRPGVRPHLFGPRRTHMPDPVDHTRSSPLRVVSATPWPWPWRFTLTQRTELVRIDGSPSLNQRLGRVCSDETRYASVIQEASIKPSAAMNPSRPPPGRRSARARPPRLLL
jgi:SAM-dependent methyltransferase